METQIQKTLFSAYSPLSYCKLMYNEKAFKVFSISSNFAKNILKLKKKKKNPNENNEQVLKKLPYKTLIKNRRKLFKNKGKLFKT